MKERLKFFGWTGLFWICFFVVGRILFLLYHFDQTAALTFRDITMILALGLRMDLAMAAYWMILTGVLLSLPLLKPGFFYYTHYAITCILVVISAVIIVVDLELYRHWGFRMNTTPLFYISREAMGSVQPGRAVVMAVVFLALTGLSIIIYRRWLAKKMQRLTPLPLKWSPVMLLATALLFLPIRSSFSVAPLNVGAVYFHTTKAFPNHAGINVVWNFFNSLSAKDQLRYPDNFFSGDARSLLAGMEHTTAAPQGVLRAPHPNIILILLESFTAKIIAPLGGRPGITPHLNSLVHEGILFDNFYASGDRTDKGLIAVLSSYPAQPQTSLIRFPHKTLHLPFLSRSLTRIGYRTSFVYGGDVGFANMEAYLTTAGFTHITDEDDFAASLNNSKWGVADQYVFDRLLQECDTSRHPFFKVMLSLSSHEPFEVPMKPLIAGTDERSLFLNACAYTDRSLGEFITRAKQAPWWDNTLVVITADHGHRFPNAAELKDKERFRIPMLWLGGALAVRDTVIHTIGGQTDVGATLLAQTHGDATGFDFSKNLLDPAANSFAVYVFQNGFGYLSQRGEYVYDFDFHNYILEKGPEADRQFGSAYMQALFNDYNKR